MDRRYQYDVAVVGGGVSGVAAAIGAARCGAKTILIERAGYLGGNATNASVTAFCGIYASGTQGIKVVGGVCDTILEQLEKLGQDTSYEVSASGNVTVKFMPEYLKCALEDAAQEAGVRLLYHCILIDTTVDNGRIVSIECADDSGRVTIEANSFVDATGDANLGYLAGATTQWGNGKGQVQVSTLSFRLDHIGECEDVSPSAIGKAICQAKAAGMENLTREKGFLIRREGQDFGYVLLPSVILKNLDAETLTRAEIDTRKQVFAYVEAMKRYMPGMEHCQLTCSGPALGIREGRKLIGRFQLTGQDIIKSVKRADSVARGGWKPEIHHDLNQMAEYVAVEEGNYFDIPLAALQSREIENLFSSGRAVSADEVAYASLRVMGTGFATGHAAGVAAAIQTLEGHAEVSGVRAELLKQGALI